MSCPECAAADQRAAELASVIEKAEDHLTRHFLDMRVADEVLPTLATAPANALRELKADVWDEGRDNPPFFPGKNPYRKGQS